MINIDDMVSTEDAREAIRDGKPGERVLDLLKPLAEARGYHFEVDPDGTERMIRPDGTVAVTAKKRRQ